jgi:hypothetical protein
LNQSYAVVLAPQIENTAFSLKTGYNNITNLIQQVVVIWFWHGLLCILVTADKVLYHKGIANGADIYLSLFQL